MNFFETMDDKLTVPKWMLYRLAETLAPAWDYIQTHQEQFGAMAGDDKTKILVDTFMRHVAAPVNDGGDSERILREFGNFEQSPDTQYEPFGEDGPGSDGFKGPRPWNGFTADARQVGGEPFAWVTLNFATGKPYSVHATEAEADAYIQQVHQSSDGVTLTKRAALSSPAKVGGDERELPVLPHPTVFAGLTLTNEPVSHAYSASQMVDYARAALSADGGDAWQHEAAKWLRSKAEKQRAINQECPEHAAAYPSWTERIATCERLAKEIEQDAAIAAAKEGAA